MDLQTSLTTAAAASAAVGWRGGRGILYAAGTWGSGTLALTWAPKSDGTFVPIGTGVSLSANGSTGFEIAEGFVKATLAGSTGATVAWGIADSNRFRKPFSDASV